MGNRFWGIPRAVAVFSVFTAVFTIGGTWAVHAYMNKENTRDIRHISGCQEILKEDVSILKQENLYQNEIIKSLTRYVEKDHEWKIRDAEWKGTMSEINQSNLFYGSAEKLQQLKLLSEENKNILKKEVE